MEERERIYKIIEKLRDINDTSFNDEFDTAIYIYIRYGFYKFQNYIDDEEISKINKVVGKRYSSLFNDDINEEVRKILEEGEM